MPRSSLAPILRFADVETFVLPAPGNGVYVWDGGLTALRQYDSTGTFVRQIGREGGGPGEYGFANGIVRLRDGRLALWDPRNTRFTLYDTAGTLANCMRSRMLAISTSASMVRMLIE